MTLLPGARTEFGIMTTHYSPEFKRFLVEKALADPGQRVDVIAAESNVGRASLFRWIKQYGPQNAGIVRRDIRPQDWSLAQKLRALLETRNMSEHELGDYLRRHGLYYSNLAQWKAEILDEVRKNGKDNKLPKNDSRYLRRIRELEKELKLKDKALREATALLALKKKVESTWGGSIV
jgi:transposase-like protein